MTLDQTWITEPCEECGSAFALKLEEKLHEEQTPFQKIEVFKTTEWGHLMTIDGFTMVSSRDNFLYHEMMAHPVLFTHDAPERVAIIGGGDCGTLREVLKHTEVAEVVQIDIDERVTRVSERYFPELCEANGDPRARLVFGDGIQWMKDAEPESLDVIVVDSTDPIGPGEVLFTEEFYRACIDALAPRGMLVQQSESPLVHMALIERMYRSLYRAGCSDVRSLFFPQPIYPTGWWSATVGRKGGRVAGFREDDVEARGFETRYYNAEIHRAVLAMPEFFKREVAAWRPAR